MEKKPIPRRNILNDILTLVVVIIVALVVIFKDRETDPSDAGPDTASSYVVPADESAE